MLYGAARKRGSAKRLSCVYKSLNKIPSRERPVSRGCHNLILKAAMWICMEPTRVCSETLNHARPGHNFFIDLCAAMPTSTIQGTSFEPLRRLGFGFWNLKKMVALEVLNMPAKLSY